MVFSGQAEDETSQNLDACHYTTIRQRACHTDDDGKMVCENTIRMLRKCPGRPVEEMKRTETETANNRAEFAGPEAAIADDFERGFPWKRSLPFEADEQGNQRPWGLPTLPTFSGRRRGDEGAAEAEDWTDAVSQMERIVSGMEHMMRGLLQGPWFGPHLGAMLPPHADVGAQPGTTPRQVPQTPDAVQQHQDHHHHEQDGRWRRLPDSWTQWWRRRSHSGTRKREGTFKDHAAEFSDA